MAEKFSHRDGLLYFDLWWHRSDPDKAFHLIKGDLTEGGPWKIAGHVITVLGCHGTDPELAVEWEAWQSCVTNDASDYPAAGLVAAIARKIGAITDQG